MEHTEILFLSFGGTTVTLSTVAAPFYIPINAQVSQLPHVLANIGCFLGSSHPIGYEIASPRGFNLHLCNDW